MGKRVYVTFNSPKFNDTGGEDGVTNLVKGLGDGYLKKPFAELLQKMADGKADEFNEAYSNLEMVAADDLSEYIRAANANPKDVQFFAMSNQQPPEKIRFRLDDRVSDYNDRILAPEIITLPDGGKQEIYKMALGVADNTVGGTRIH
ncbi:hypothetical protein HY638_05390 [Candidatus Woesearchaeota archaeon]|nr:hypothetical protein [Candidatus Woesearchaeota archaeon]